MTNLVGVQWQGLDLRGTSMRGALLGGANLRGVRLDDVDLRGADLWGANLSLASLRRADLRGARVSCASFAGADLRCAQLAGAEMTFTDFGEALLYGANFGRPRSHARYAEAWAPGAPSFCDAVLVMPSMASRMDTRALLVVDAALDLSDSPDDEVTGLLCTAGWPAFSFGAMAVIRRGVAKQDHTHLLVERLQGSPDVSATAAVALLHTGYPVEELAQAQPALLEVPLASGPYRSAVHWTKRVRTRLEKIESWPARAVATPSRAR